MSTLSALALSALLACAHDRQATRSDDKELADLSTRTELFWRSIQWQDPASAAACIEDDAARRLWSLEAERLVEQVRVTDASLVDLQLGEVLTDREDGRVREATVLVRTEGYAMPAQVVKRETVTQTWYRSPDGWYLDWKDGHPLTGQPW